MIDGEAYVRQYRAEQLQAQADSLTEFRGHAAYITGPTMAILGESWPLAILEAVAGATDWLDGHKAKEASALAGYNINPDGKDNDRNADKKLTYSGMIGTMIRDITNGNHASGGFVGATILCSAVRDRAIGRRRAESTRKESSILVNRVNTVLRIGSLTIGMSPLGRTKTGRRVRNTGLGMSTVLATYGYFQTKKQLTSE